MKLVVDFANDIGNHWFKSVYSNIYCLYWDPHKPRTCKIHCVGRT